MKTVGIPVSPGEFFDSVIFRLIDIPGEDVGLLSRYPEEANRLGEDMSEALSPALQRTLFSDAVVLLIGSEKIEDNER